VLSRIRFFFEDVAERRRRRKGAREAESVVAAAAAAKSAPSPEITKSPSQGAVAAPAEEPSAPQEPAPSAEGADSAVTAEIPAAARKRRLLRRPSIRRPSLRRPSLPRPSLPRPRLPRPRRPSPRLKRPGRRGLIVGGIVLLLLAAVAAVYLVTDFDFDGDPEPAPAPRIVVEEEAAPREAPELGFPAFATKNTTRVAGEDPIADAAGVALATSPATGGIEGPPAVTLIPEGDWTAAVAAAVLVADPVGAPILVSTRDEVPDLTLTALTALAPQGSPKTGDSQLFRIGNAVAPRGLRLRNVLGGNPAELAAEIADLRERLTGRRPEHVVLASSDRPEFSMPAAAWAARSGDPVLYVQRDSVPAPTLEKLRDLGDVPTYLLAPESVVSDKVADRIRKETEVPPRRIGEDDPITNAIAFARYTDGTFGWNITDPGHGLVIANATRPIDAGAAAPLSASGKWGPLLLTEDADSLPAPLEGFLLDIKPGFVTDPTRAVYNHAWLIGDDSAISVDVQAQIDELLELAQVQSGRGQTDFGDLPPQTQPEAEPDTTGGRDQ
jgi:hypothetical protein